MAVVELVALDFGAASSAVSSPGTEVERSSAAAAAAAAALPLLADDVGVDADEEM